MPAPSVRSHHQVVHGRQEQSQEPSGDREDDVASHILALSGRSGARMNFTAPSDDGSALRTNGNLFTFQPLTSSTASREILTTTNSQADASNSSGVPADEDSRPRKQRKTTHVSKACQHCRRRKSRCDGARPSCSTCVVFGQECSYDPAQDGRKPPSRDYVRSLEERLRVLEAAIQDKYTSDCSSFSPSQAEDAQPLPRDALPPVSSGGLFKVMNKDYVLAYGSTSSYMHVEDAGQQANGPHHHNGSNVVNDDSSLADETELFSQHTVASIDDWASASRMLPAALPRDLHDEFLSYFFTYVNCFTLFVDEARFYRDLKVCTSNGRPESATAWYSPLLHNVLLAVGCKYSKDPRLHDLDFSSAPSNTSRNASIPLKERGLAFAQTAVQYLEREMSAPFLSTVIGCMLLGTYYQNSAKPTLGWVYEGIGVRLALVLGLHMKGTDLAARGIISHELKRARDYCWLTVGIQDKLWSYTHGRLPAIRSIDTENIDPPAPSPSMDTVPWKSFPEGVTLPGLRSTIQVNTAKLTGLAERIHTLNYSMRTVKPMQYQLERSQVYMELMAWHRALPSSCSIGLTSTQLYTPHCINLNIYFWYLQILLYRTHFRLPGGPQPNEPSPSASSICVTAAHRILNLLRMWHNQHDLARSGTPSLPNITFCTGTIFILSIANEADRAKRSMENLEETIHFLREIGRNSSFATLSADALQHMAREWLPAPESPVPVTRALKEGQDVLTSQLAQLNDPTSALSKVLASMGWTPPSAKQQADSRDGHSPHGLYNSAEGGSVHQMTTEYASVPAQGLQSLLSPSSENLFDTIAPVALDASGSNSLNDIASNPFSAHLNPEDFTFSLHPSFYSSFDDQFSSLFPQHYGGNALL